MMYFRIASILVLVAAVTAEASAPPETQIINGIDCPISNVVVVHHYCDQGAPHFDPEGVVCANDYQRDEAYCSYDISPTACAYCSIGFDCEERNPCDPLLVEGEHYYPGPKTHKFVQCSEYGECNLKRCPKGQKWNQDLKACVWRAADSMSGSDPPLPWTGFDPPQWKSFDSAAERFDEGYVGNYETADTTEISDKYVKNGAAFVFDLGSSGSSFRRRGPVITLSEIRAIWAGISPIVEENNGVVLKSVGDSLYMYFEKVSEGLTATNTMYLALVAGWRAKVALACDVHDAPDWCGDEEEERKRFFNTAAYGGGYGELLLIPEDGAFVDAYGAAANNAFFAGEEEAEHGECIIDEGALQQFLLEAGQDTQDDACSNGVVNWTEDELGVNRFIVRKYPFGCYYTVCFDVECKIPDDE